MVFLLISRGEKFSDLQPLIDPGRLNNAWFDDADKRLDAFDGDSPLIAISHLLVEKKIVVLAYNNTEEVRNMVELALRTPECISAISPSAAKTLGFSVCGDCLRPQFNEHLH